MGCKCDNAITAAREGSIGHIAINRYTPYYNIVSGLTMERWTTLDLTPIPLSHEERENQKDALVAAPGDIIETRKMREAAGMAMCLYCRK
jgi:hypothetical protein